MDYSTKILIIIVVALGVIVSVFGYQIYQLNHSLLILKSNFLPNQSINPTGEGSHDRLASINLSNTEYSSQPITVYTSPSVQNQSNEQSSSQSGAGGTGGSGGAGGGGGQQTEYQDPIISALIPEPFSILPVVVRTSIIALSVFIIVKWLGGKGIGQLSPFGLLIVVGLGSAIGDPMIYNEISIPQALVAVIIVVVFFKIIDYLTLKSKRFRKSVEPNPILLVDFGKIDKEGLNKAKMDKEEFEIEMRLAGIESADQIKFARLEPNGRISFILRNKEKNRNID